MVLAPLVLSADVCWSRRLWTHSWTVSQRTRARRQAVVQRGCGDRVHEENAAAVGSLRRSAAAPQHRSTYLWLLLRLPCETASWTRCCCDWTGEHPPGTGWGTDCPAHAPTKTHKRFYHPSIIHPSEGLWAHLDDGGGGPAEGLGVQMCGVSHAGQRAQSVHLAHCHGNGGWCQAGRNQGM